MSTRLTELPLPVVGARNLPWRAFALAAALTALAVMLFAGTFAFALTALNAERIVPGTVVAGVPVGGLNRASAEVRLREELPSLSTGHLSVTFGATSQQISYAEIGRDYDVDAMLDQAYAVGREGDMFSQAQEQLRIALRGATVQPQVTWDENALERKLLDLAAAADRSPIEATITREAGRFVVHPSAEGRTVDVQAAWRQALTAVSSLSPADAPVVVEPVVTHPTVITAQAQVAVDRAERVAAADLALTSTAEPSAIPADTIRGWIRLDEAGPGAWTLVIERSPVAQFVAQQSATVYKAPVDASFKWQAGEAVAVPGANGTELDVETTTESVYTALANRADGTAVASVAMTVRSVEPAFTTAMAVDLAPKVVKVSEWTTGFQVSERNFFGANIIIPAQLINGTVVPVGSTFDFWATVGSLSDVPGIGPGGAIIHGRTQPTGALGGGICSCSTTLFNAALRYGLDMGKRRNHAYYIDRYPTGLDATVWRSGSATQNMTFTNDTPYPIIIRGLKGENNAQCDGELKLFSTVRFPNCVIFELWTIDVDRSVSFSRPVITNLKVAKDYLEYARIKPDKTPLAPGERLRIEYPTNGFTSVVVRTVRDADGNVIHRDTYTSKYIRVQGVTLVGWQEGDPAVGTQVLNPDPFPPYQPPEAAGVTPI